MQEKQEKTIKILLVEDHPMTRVGIKYLLDATPQVEVAAEAGNGKEAVDAAATVNPDIVLMDVGMPVMDGIEAARIIREKNQDIKIIMLTSHDSEADVFAALSAGANGYCLKTVSPEQLSLAIQTVMDGAAWLDPGIARQVLGYCSGAGKQEKSGSGTTSAQPRQGQTADSTLSDREIEVLTLVVEGLSNKEIADRLILSPETIKSHLRRIMQKLAVSDRTQAAVKAMREGLL